MNEKKFEMIAAARRIALTQGITGGRGGWLYRNGKPYCHGWFQLALRYIRQGKLANVEWRGLKRYVTVVVDREAT